jgi:hypothetical protein
MNDKTDSSNKATVESIAYEGFAFSKDRVAIGPCEHVDSRLIALLRDVVTSLYSAVAGARALPTGDEERDALQHLLVASAAIAATEAEAMISLCSVDLCAPARIHARALGDIARRFSLLSNHRDVEIDMYRALEAARAELLAGASNEWPGGNALEPLAVDAEAQAVERIERDAYDRDDQSEGIFMGAAEARMLTRWNHADVVALADAGDRLLAAGPRVRASLVVDRDTDLLLHRAIGKALVILHVMAARFGLSLRETLDELINRHALAAERFRRESTLLQARMAGLEKSEA